MEVNRAATDVYKSLACFALSGSINAFMLHKSYPFDRLSDRLSNCP